MRKPYLTKSRFKLALECVTQLYYTGKEDIYPDQKLDDKFLLELAKGGYQVGELSKYIFCEDPKKELITIDTLDYDQALKATEQTLQSSGRIVIAEAAFKYKNLFVRVDLLVKEGNVIHIYEVKAKSYDQNDDFLNARGTGILSKWTEYVYDIAFQRFVIRHALEDSGYKIKTHLLLVNKDVVTDIDGLHQNFKIFSEDGRIKVITKENLKRSDLGKQILLPVATDDVCDLIENTFPVPTDLDPNISFEDFIWRVSDIYIKDEKVITPLGSKCKICTFHLGPNDGPEKKSGFLECWKEKMRLPEINRALVTELWNGLSGPRSYANELVAIGKYYLHHVDERDIVPSTFSKKSVAGLTPHARRMEQVNREKKQTIESYFDADGLKSEIAKWRFPLHMIDFETSAVAIPFFKGMRPYEGVAFQFSHHIINEDWSVRHQTQFLSFEPGCFPNFDFVRNLKKALENDNGTIFRYHNHENTYLNMIYRQLQTSNAPDKSELMKFIDAITHDKSRNHIGHRDMVDLYQLVIQYYYPPSAKGSNSLKQILPAIIADSGYLKEKYGKSGVYGTGKEVHSLNFDDHIWIQESFGNNPYKTLPKVFANYDAETLDLLVRDMEELADGGTAMTAYNYLQFSEVPVDQRIKISDSLLRYCELDTLAMVMLLEGWRDKL